MGVILNVSFVIARITIWKLANSAYNKHLNLSCDVKINWNNFMKLSDKQVLHGLKFVPGVPKPEN